MNKVVGSEPHEILLRLSSSIIRESQRLLIVALVCASMQGMAQLTWGDWQYSINGNNVIVTLYTGRASDVSIPSVINGLPVQYIDIGAFSTISSLTNVFIPSSIYAVLNGSGVVPFASCLNLVSIVVDPMNMVFSSADGVLFNKKQTSLLEFPSGKRGTYNIPMGVLRVSPYAFVGCANLTNVTIPNTVTNIMSAAFRGCTGLTSITIPASVQSIDSFAFNGCDYLTNIFFAGIPPVVWDGPVFAPSWVILPKTMYYIPGTVGWGPTYAGYPTAPLNLRATAPTVYKGQFSFSVTGPSGISAVVESSTNLDSTTWSLIQTGSLGSGSFFIADPDWAKYPTRYYRVRLQY